MRDSDMALSEARAKLREGKGGWPTAMRAAFTAPVEVLDREKQVLLGQT